MWFSSFKNKMVDMIKDVEVLIGKAALVIWKEVYGCSVYVTGNGKACGGATAMVVDGASQLR